jgi:protein-L-isoaspartate(D-aspartate) O-methyltransferase
MMKGGVLVNTSISPQSIIRVLVPFLFLVFLTPFAVGMDSTEPDTPVDMPVTRDDGYSQNRKQMVLNQIEARGVDDEEVLRAMRTVPRHQFVPEEERQRAYNDHAIPIGYGQTISQPFVVAYMTVLLDIRQGDRVLEIGTGSGYQAAVLAELTDEVYTVEIIEELAVQASSRLSELGYLTIDVKNVDGYWGWDEAAPFDGIIVTAAAGHIPPPLVEQLAPGGRIVIPVGHPYDIQYITVIEKSQSGRLTGRQLLPVQFVPFTGQIETMEP